MPFPWFTRRTAPKRRAAARRPVRLAVEALEERLALSGNVTAALARGTLTLTGDPLANHVVLSQPGFGQLTLTPADGTTVNGQARPLTFTGVTGDLNIGLGRGADEVDFDLANPIFLLGNLTIDYGASPGGNGNKTTETVNATSSYLTVAGNLTVRYAAGSVTTVFDNLDVGGNVSVRHGVGDSTFTIDNRVGGEGPYSNVYGNVTVTNTQGRAQNLLADTNVFGNVAFANGLARASDNDAGFNVFDDNHNNTTLATVGGNVSFSNLTGDSHASDDVLDVHVKGNVTLNLGSGNFQARVGNDAIQQEPVIEGDLNLTGTGSDTVTLGKAGSGPGLRVMGRLNVRLGLLGDNLDLEDVHVASATSIATGAGNDTVTIDADTGSLGSVFAGAFALKTGGGMDMVRINSNSGDRVTDFQGPVRVNLGGGDDSLFLATAGTVKFEAAANLPVVFDGGTGINGKTAALDHLPDRVPTFLHFV
jgi:hypothetical protein